MEDANRSIESTHYLPSLCPISKLIPRWHLKSGIKVVYFVPTKIIISLDCIELPSLPVSLRVSKRAPHRLRLLLKPSPPLLPVQSTQSSLRTAATPIVCSFYAVKSSVFFPSFIPRTSASRVPESYQSYPTSPPTTPAIHSTIPYSMTLTSPLAIYSSELPPPPSLLLPPPPSLSFAVVIAIPSTSASAASASASDAYHYRSFSITGSGIDQNSSEVFGGVLETHSVSIGYASLVRFSYYIPRQY
jgi:hypothetical protein